MSSTKLPDSFSAAARDDFAGSDGELLLQRGDRPRREEPRHDLAQPGVLRRVVVDQQRLGQLELFGCGAVGQPHDGALAVGRPQVAVAGDRLDVLVTADHPVAAVVEDRVGLLVPPHRRGLAQLGELGDGDALDKDIGVGEVIPAAERTCALRHTQDHTLRCQVYGRVAVLTVRSNRARQEGLGAAAQPAPGRGAAYPHRALARRRGHRDEAVGGLCTGLCRCRLEGDRGRARARLSRQRVRRRHRRGVRRSCRHRAFWCRRAEVGNRGHRESRR